MSVYVTDTHPLVWFTLNEQRNLSKPVLRVFESALSGTAFIHVPAMVLYEIAILEKQRKVDLTNGFRRWTENLLSETGFGITHLEPDMIRTAVGFSFNGDPFDKAIAATAVELELPLITRDSAITDSGLVEILW